MADLQKLATSLDVAGWNVGASEWLHRPDRPTAVPDETIDCDAPPQTKRFLTVINLNSSTANLTRQIIEAECYRIRPCFLAIHGAQGDDITQIGQPESHFPITTVVCPEKCEERGVL